MRLLKKGTTGADVRTLQQKLGINADGIFGPNTEKHVERFQLAHNLPVNGMVDNNMWSLILNLENVVIEEIDEDTDSPTS